MFEMIAKRFVLMKYYFKNYYSVVIRFAKYYVIFFANWIVAC